MPQTTPHTGGQDGGHPVRTTAWPEILIGAATLAAAVLVAVQIKAIPVSPLYSKVGPTVFPWITCGGLALLGAALLVAGLRGGWQTEAETAVAIEWPAVAWVAAGLLINVAVIDTLGFTVASTFLFVAVSRGFGSRRTLRDAGIGFTVALLAYFGFARALGVDIGAGLLEKLLGV